MKGRFSRATGLVSLIGLMAGCGASDDKTPPAAAPAAAARSDAPQTASAPRSESKSTVSTPKPQSDPGAATPTEALSEFLAAARKGDVSRMSAFLAPPMDSLTLERAQLGSDILAAHEKLLNELDAAFGPRTDQSKRPFGSELAERVLGSYSADSFATAAGKLGNPRVVDQREEPGRVLLTVEVTPTGKQEPIRLKWAAIKAEQGW